MSSNNNHIITISNYEEWFVLYMDKELSAAQQKMVEDFLRLHPHLQEELDLLLSTKLPQEDVVFSGREELLAASMKLNTVEESLLLYIDNELPAAESKMVKERLLFDKDLRLQYELLQKTKLDGAEVVPYPDKKSLYRRTERRVLLPVWMRVAAAAVVFLAGGYFFLLNPDQHTGLPAGVAVIKAPVAIPVPSTPGSPIQKQSIAPQPDLMATASVTNKEKRKEEERPTVLPVSAARQEPVAMAEPVSTTVAVQQHGTVRVEASKLLAHSTAALNNSVANLPVTSERVISLNITEDPVESAVTGGDDKQNHRSPAKGFLRKVSRFIERRTGIGTVNADNELLVGAVALKLN